MIKRLLIAALLAAPMAQANTIEEACIDASNFAYKSYMDAANGTPYGRGLNSAKGDDYKRLIVANAYSLPQWRVEDRQRSEASKFSSLVYRDCVVRYSR